MRFMSRKMPGRGGPARGNSIVALDSGGGDGDTYPPKGESSVYPGISDNPLCAPTHASPPEQKKKETRNLRRYPDWLAGCGAVPRIIHFVSLAKRN